MVIYNEGFLNVLTGVTPPRKATLKILYMQLHHIQPLPSNLYCSLMVLNAKGLLVLLQSELDSKSTSSLL